MPSIKKRVTGFIRQFSAPSTGGGAAANQASAAAAAKEAVKGKSKSCGGGGGGGNGPCKSPKMDSSKCHPDGFIQRYLNG